MTRLLIILHNYLCR